MSKKKTSNKKSKQRSVTNNESSRIPYFLLMVAVVVCMLCSGGFNWQHCIFPLSLMIIYLLSNHKRINKSCIVLSVIMLAAICISMITTQGDPRAAVYETEKQLFILVAFLAGTVIARKDFAYVHFFTALILAFAGVICYCFRLKIADFVLDIGALPRLQSFIQYANSTACLLGSGYICFFAVENKNYYMRCFAQLILIAVYLTISKACIPMLVLVCTFLAWKNKDERKYIIFQNLIAMVFFLPIAICADQGYYLLSAGLCVVCILVGGIAYKEKNNAFRIWCVIVGVSALAFVALLVYRPQLLNTFTERLVFMKDAWQATFENLMGHGAGSWGVLQYKYQSTPYSVTYIHNGWLQILFENGIVLFLCIALLTLYSVYSFYKRKDTVLLALLVFISAHSMLDFDFSFPSVLILFGMLLGIGTKNIEIKRISALYSRIAFVLLIAVLCLGNIHMLNEFSVRNSFENKYRDGDIIAAKKTALLLEKICPYDAKLQMSLASISQKQGAGDSVVRKRLGKAVSISPNNPEIYRSYMKYEMDSGDILKMCETYIQMCPRQYPMVDFIKEYSAEAYEKGLITESEKNTIMISAQKNIKY